MNDANLIAFVATKSPEAAERFYRTQLALEFVDHETSAIIFNSNGIMLRVSKVESFEPAPFTVLGWEVDDIESEIDQLMARDVVFERFDGFEQDERGIAKFPDGTKVAWFRDPDGNVLSLTQFEDRSS